jgi:hypothetical protein
MLASWVMDNARFLRDESGLTSGFEGPWGMYLRLPGRLGEELGDFLPWPNRLGRSQIRSLNLRLRSISRIIPFVDSRMMKMFCAMYSIDNLR